LSAIDLSFPILLDDKSIKEGKAGFKKNNWGESSIRKKPLRGFVKFIANRFSLSPVSVVPSKKRKRSLSENIQ
jgi:hypothetical protein